MTENKGLFKQKRKPDARGKKKGECGDQVDVYIWVRENRIHHIDFQIEGCEATLACTRMLSHLAAEKHVERAWEITPEDIIRHMDHLAPEKHHCAELVMGAFYLALRDYMDKKRAPWKKLYQ